MEIQFEDPGIKLRNQLVMFVFAGLVMTIVGIVSLNIGFKVGSGIDLPIFEPVVGQTVYVSSALAETQNPTQEYLGEYVYTPGEPVVILSIHENVAKVLFMDGHTGFYSLDWFDPIPYGQIMK
ncbi:MAG: hypothetical protein HYV90_05985 [Candidatus Woesebacteria bacterium]|nr:MAG: hypothetical protein HYV90_05985 [Candidatus Woesebacteria bacterium]